MQHFLLKILLSPFSLLYGIGVAIRNVLYESKILKSTSFSLPVIGIGNIAIGGSGKTPHVEYLIRLLQPYMKVGVLSRGYLRKTKGYWEVEKIHSSEQTGDEPLQYKQKYPETVVSVAERRVIGIPRMVRDYPELKCILLDDAFQHRAVKPFSNIILTDYKYPYFEDHLLPSGRLREWRKGVERANAVIVTKCPENFVYEDVKYWKQKLKLKSDQQLFFSTYEYGTPYHMYDSTKKIELSKDTDVIQLCGIAKPIYLKEYLQKQVKRVHLHQYEDHHRFNAHEISLVKRSLQEIQNDNKIVITTEKDSTRLNEHQDFLIQNEIPIYILPIKVKFFNFKDNDFDEYIKASMLKFKS